jgi:predicted nucleic acid-binding protein
MEQVIDACALLVYLKREPGFEKVKELLVKASKQNQNILMSAVNFGEAHYVLIKNYGLEEAERIIDVIDTLPIDIVSADAELARRAAVFKAAKRLAYVDAFVAALAQKHDARIITSDYEFKSVEKEIDILWI